MNHHYDFMGVKMNPEKEAAAIWMFQKKTDVIHKPQKARLRIWIQRTMLKMTKGTHGSS